MNDGPMLSDDWSHEVDSDIYTRALEMLNAQNLPSGATTAHFWSSRGTGRSLYDLLMEQSNEQTEGNEGSD